ncbi:hypothetical protein [Rhizosaccharibacter radicis]|uniref:Uncharacterized protein n=1 Tax=Rhizosaccharibacter radicis TaxID=2782605 RepID=A0ABT1VWU8_9PROT|nr:hypothetical protein [Acetobacteraceae bacterium KSS12]
MTPMMKRAAIIPAMMVVGFLMASVAGWGLEMRATTATWDGDPVSWLLWRGAVVVGLVLLVVGFRMLGATRVRRTQEDIREGM